MSDCIFCKIINKEIPAEIVFEDELCVAFDDIRPKARVHLLIVPKKHIPTVSEIQTDDELLMGHLILMAKKIAFEKEAKGYNLIFNVGKEAGQEVFHVHLHLLGK